jgi:ferredoxin
MLFVSPNYWKSELDRDPNEVQERIDELKGASDLIKPLPLLDLKPRKFSTKKKKVRKITNTTVAQENDGTMFTDSLEAANDSVGGSSTDSSVVARQITVIQSGEVKNFKSIPGKSLLNAAKDSEVNLPHSCVMGGCGACKVKLISGEVVLTTPHCLDSAEMENGVMLACRATAMTDIKIEISETI